jgi:hypothetical protein
VRLYQRHRVKPDYLQLMADDMTGVSSVKEVRKGVSSVREVRKGAKWLCQVRQAARW